VQHKSLPVNLEEAGEDVISRTIGELKALGPQLIMPCHCTGFEATSRFAQEMPGQFLLGAVGTTLRI
jgi:7,8-dihydropterin-6-yl-methyl-4-(beta-D-ribofuranosyl)aminobenzene 5'-phosphate synthase